MFLFIYLAKEKYKYFGGVPVILILFKGQVSWAHIDLCRIVWFNPPNLKDEICI